MSIRFDLKTRCDIAILGAVDVNDARDYYHYSDGPKYTHGYNDLPSCCYCALL
jgi:hypothetical protein